MSLSRSFLKFSPFFLIVGLLGFFSLYLTAPEAQAQVIDRYSFNSLEYANSKYPLTLWVSPGGGASACNEEYLTAFSNPSCFTEKTTVVNGMSFDFKVATNSAGYLRLCPQEGLGMPGTCPVLGINQGEQVTTAVVITRNNGPQATPIKNLPVELRGYSSATSQNVSVYFGNQESDTNIESKPFLDENGNVFHVFFAQVRSSQASQSFVFDDNILVRTPLGASFDLVSFWRNATIEDFNSFNSIEDVFDFIQFGNLEPEPSEPIEGFDPNKIGTRGAFLEIISPLYGTTFPPEIDDINFLANLRINDPMWFRYMRNVGAGTGERYFLKRYIKIYGTDIKVYQEESPGVDLEVSVTDASMDIAWTIPNLNGGSMLVGIELWKTVCIGIFGLQFNCKDRVEDYAETFINMHFNSYEQETGFQNPSQNPESPLTDCANWDIGCQIQKALEYLLYPSTSFRDKVSQFNSILETRFPFAYIYDVVDIFSGLSFEETDRSDIDLTFNFDIEDLNVEDDEMEIQMMTTEGIIGDEGFISNQTWSFLRLLVGLSVYLFGVFWVYRKVTNIKL